MTLDFYSINQYIKVSFNPTKIKITPAIFNVHLPNKRCFSFDSLLITPEPVKSKMTNTNRGSNVPRAKMAGKRKPSLLPTPIGTSTPKNNHNNVGQKAKERVVSAA